MATRLERGRSGVEQARAYEAPDWYEQGSRTYPGGGADFGFSAIDAILRNAMRQGGGGGGGIPLGGTQPTAPTAAGGAGSIPSLSAPVGRVPWEAMGRSVPFGSCGGGASSALKFLNSNLFTSLLGLGGDVLGGISQGQQANQAREFQEKLLADQRAARALEATQMDPFTQQKSRQRQALLNSLLGSYQPPAYQPGGITGGINVPSSAFDELRQFTTPEARANAEAWFHNIATQSSPPYFAPDLSQMGYGSGPGIPSVQPPPTPPGDPTRTRPPDAPIRGRARRRTLGLI